MKNPYMIALTFVTVLLAIVGIILLITGANTKDTYGLPDHAAGVGYTLAGWGALGGALFALLFTLLLGGMRWVETVTQARPDVMPQRRGPAESNDSKPDWP